MVVNCTAGLSALFCVKAWLFIDNGVMSVEYWLGELSRPLNVHNLHHISACCILALVSNSKGIKVS